MNNKHECTLEYVWNNKISRSVAYDQYIQQSNLSQEDTQTFLIQDLPQYEVYQFFDRLWSGLSDDQTVEMKIDIFKDIYAMLGHRMSKGNLRMINKIQSMDADFRRQIMIEFEYSWKNRNRAIYQTMCSVIALRSAEEGAQPNHAVLACVDRFPTHDADFLFEHRKNTEITHEDIYDMWLHTVLDANLLPGDAKFDKLRQPVTVRDVFDRVFGPENKPEDEAEKGEADSSMEQSTVVPEVVVVLDDDEEMQSVHSNDDDANKMDVDVTTPKDHAKLRKASCDDEDATPAPSEVGETPADKPDRSRTPRGDRNSRSSNGSSESPEKLD